MRWITLIWSLLVFSSLLKSQNAYTPTDAYDQEIRLIKERITKSLETDDYEGLAKAYYDRARANMNTPLNHRDIIADLNESAKFYKRLKDDLGYQNSRMALAEFYILEEVHLDEALRLTAGAYSFYKNNGIKPKMIAATTQMGRVYQLKQDYEKALPYVEQALKGSIEIGDAEAELQSRLLITELFGNLGNVERVIQQGKYAINLEKEYDLASITPRVQCVIATNLYLDGQIDSSLSYALLALEGATDDLKHQERNHELLSKIYRTKRKYKSAYYHANKASDLKTQQYNQEKYALSNQIAVKYQTQEKEKEIQELEEDNQLIDNKLTKRTRMLVILPFLFLLAAGAAYYMYQSQRRKLAIKNLIAEQKAEIAKQKINELENSLNIKNLKAVVKGQEAERTRIANDLHDSLGGMLSTLKLHYDTLQVDHKELSDDQDYNKIMDLIDEACKDVRDIARNLKPNALEKMGLNAALKDLINRYTIRGTMDISLHTNEIDGLLSEDARLHVYRIVQELLNNALKHANATEIDVQLNRNDEELFVMVEDNGRGFDLDTAKRGLGLGNLNSRVNLLKGEMQIDSAPNRGTSVIVHIPLEHAAQLA